MSPQSVALDHEKGTKPTLLVQCPYCRHTLLMSADSEEECEQFLNGELIAHVLALHDDRIEAM